MTELDNLINKFLQFGPNAFTGIKRVDSDEELDKVKKNTEEFLEEYPFLKKDPGYIEFLTKYSGCFFFRKKDGFAIDVFGLAPRCTLHWMGNDRIDIEPGFLLFSYIYRRAYFNMQIDYGFDMTGKRKWGVYAHYCYSDNKEFEHQFSSFAEWLEEVVELKEDILRY